MQISVNGEPRDLPPGETVATLIAALGLSACSDTVGYTQPNGDKIRGKELFVKSCGSCHTLRDATTTGAVGPDLDYAFVQSRIDGLGEDTILQVVRAQIAYPVTSPSTERAAIRNAAAIPWALEEPCATTATPRRPSRRAPPVVLGSISSRIFNRLRFAKRPPSLANGSPLIASTTANIVARVRCYSCCR